MADSEKRKSTREHKSYTPWHILLDDVMDHFFDSKEIEVRAFEKLGSLPLESDFIILRKKQEDEELKSALSSVSFSPSLSWEGDGVRV